MPTLLDIIGSNAAPDARKVPLLFFAVSSLVRMASLPPVAQAVQQQGGLPKLVQALHVVPAAICQVGVQWRCCARIRGGGLSHRHGVPCRSPQSVAGRRTTACGTMCGTSVATARVCKWTCGGFLVSKAVRTP